MIPTTPKPTTQLLPLQVQTLAVSSQNLSQPSTLTITLPAQRLRRPI
jgi:hypothetical protein